MPGSPAFASRVPLRPVEAPLYLDVGLGRTDPPPIRSLRASVKLDVLGANDEPQAVEFRVDTGAGMSLMSLTRAEGLGLPTDGRRGWLKLTTANEEKYEEVVVGTIRVRFPGSDRVFHWDCLFVAGRPKEAPSLLGLQDVVHTLRITVDRAKHPDAPDGSILFEDYTPPAPPPAG